MARRVTLLLIALIPIHSFAASFDCNRATTNVEKMICDSPPISKSDEDLAAAYAEVLKTATDQAVIKNQQREWLARQRQCREEMCLMRLYASRITELTFGRTLAAKATPPTPVHFDSGTSQLDSRYHIAFIAPDGVLWAWGTNDSFQVGNGSRIEVKAPTKIAAGFVQVVVGSQHTLAIDGNGVLWGWGANYHGQLGGERLGGGYPIKMGDGFISAAANDLSSFAIKRDGTLWTWGGVQTDGKGNLIDELAEKPRLMGTSYAFLAARDGHFAALKRDGTLWTWGQNLSGQLGSGRCGDDAVESRPVLVGSNFARVSVGYEYTAAIKTDGTLWAWGHNYRGTLGDGTEQDRYAPVKIGDGYARVVAGYMNTAAIKTDGTLWAWGGNESGLFGDCTTASHLSPVKLGDGFAQVSLGQRQYRGQGDFIVATKLDGSVWTWGWQWAGDQSDTPKNCRKPTRVVFGGK